MSYVARIRLEQAVESWHCGLAQNLEVFKAEADFASDCKVGIQSTFVLLRVSWYSAYKFSAESL
jgi:hypothetical protein